MEVLDVKAIVLDPSSANVTGGAFQGVCYFSKFVPVFFLEGDGKLLN
jgi:hypothetical protein